MPSLRLSISLALLTAACGASARYQTIGNGRTVVAGAPAAVGPGADATAGMAAAVALPADRTDATYRVDLNVWLPRATIVDWTVRCGSATRTGFVGEPFEQYRERRLAELRAMQARQQRAASAVGGLVGGAVVGQTQATAAVATPAAEGQATVAVDGQAAGAAAGAALVSTDVELAVGDLGQGYRRATATMLVPEQTPGACAVELAPREALDAQALAYLTGTFAVARLDDTAHWQAVQDQKQSLAVRADLRAHLIARGGDLDWRRKQAEAQRQAAQALRDQRAQAEQAARAQRDRVARVESDRRVQLQISIDGRAHATRQTITGYLTMHGADPGRRARLQAEARVRARAEWEAQVALRAQEQARHDQLAAAAGARAELAWRAALEVRLRLRGVLIGRGADPALRARLEAQARAEREARWNAERAAEAERAARADAEAAADLERWRRGEAERDRRLQMAMGVRAMLTAQLTGRGARVRPPMPEPVDEMPGEPPLPGYAWVGGEWAWTAGEWRWMPGMWQGPMGSGGAATTTTVIGGGGGVTVGGGAGVSVGGVTVTVGGSAGTKPPPPRPRTQDHR